MTQLSSGPLDAWLLIHGVFIRLLEEVVQVLLRYFFEGFVDVAAVLPVDARDHYHYEKTGQDEHITADEQSVALMVRRHQ